MEGTSTTPFGDSNFQIPFDLFVSKQRKGVGSSGFLRFSDSLGNLVYKVPKLSRKSTDHPHNNHSIKLVLDSSDNTLISIHRVRKGSWKGFRGKDNEGKYLLFEVERSLDEFTRTEFGILLLGETNEESNTELRMKGCPFKRSCTIYKGNSIVAESSLMYKLEIGKMFVPRNLFRVTIFPGFTDHSLVVSLIVIFFYGRKLWM